MKIRWILIVLFIIALIILGRYLFYPQLNTKEVSSVSEAILRIQSTSKLYTSQIEAQGSVTYEWDRSFDFKIIKGVIPFSHKSVTIPVTVIYKAYIDFSNFSDRNITHDDGTNIKLVLPDPLIELTSSKVEHDAIRRNEELLAESLPEADADKLSKQAMDDIWATLDYSSIVERAKQDAIDKIAPLFYHLGYNSVTMDFASEQSILDNITQFLDFSKLNI